MSSAVLAFGRNDLASIRRDRMLRMLLVAPLVYVAMVRFPVPPLTEMLHERYAFDLVPYYPLITSFFVVVGPAALLGSLGALVILEERDTGTLGALRVTPVPMATYATYRAATVVAVTALYAVACALGSGIAPRGILPGLVAAALCSGLLAAVVTVFIALVAGNKVEALALLRAVGMLLLVVPTVPFFVTADWAYAFGLLPSYWPFKIYWVAATGMAFWPFALAGVGYNLLLVVLLVRAFNQQ